MYERNKEEFGAKNQQKNRSLGATLRIKEAPHYMIWGFFDWGFFDWVCMYSIKVAPAKIKKLAFHFLWGYIDIEKYHFIGHVGLL